MCVCVGAGGDSNNDRRGKSYVQENRRHGMTSETSEDEAKRSQQEKDEL